MQVHQRIGSFHKTKTTNKQTNKGTDKQKTPKMLTIAQRKLQLGELLMQVH